MNIASRMFYGAAGAIATAVVFSIVLRCAGGSRDEQATAVAGYYKQLSNGWVHARAALSTQKQINAKLVSEINDLDYKYRKEARVCVELRAQLREHSGSGQAAVDDTAAVLDDQYLWVRYKFQKKAFDYTIKRRPLGIILIHRQDGSYLASGHDALTGEKIIIDTLAVIEAPGQRPWWKDIALGAGCGYIGMPLIGASMQYKRDNAILLGGWRDGPSAGWFYNRKF